jgi:hypothetical protein
MMLDDQDLRDLPYVERKARLAELVQRSRIGRLYHSEAFTDGEKLLAECSRRGLEGIVSKRRDSLYRVGKSSAWIKVGARLGARPTGTGTSSSSAPDREPMADAGAHHDRAGCSRRCEHVPLISVNSKDVRNGLMQRKGRNDKSRASRSSN